MNKIFALCASLLISFNAAAQAPANDDCSNAVLLTPSVNSVCATTTAGTTVDATASGIPDCNAQLSKDVWYKFVATQTYHKIIVRDASPSILINLQFFSSADGTCTNLISMNCTTNNGSGDSTTYKAYNLTIGKIYFVKVYTPSYYSGFTSFNICVTSPPNIPKPANDSCQNATILIPSSNANILVATNGTCVGATPGVNDCYSRQSDDVWYKFQAIAGNHKVIVKGQDFLDNLGIMEYRWDECSMLPYNGDCVTSYSGDSMVYSIKNLTIGQYYYFRVTTDADDANRAFTISVTTPVLPSNDECVDAQILVPQQDWAPTSGTTKEATEGDNFYQDCNYYSTYDVWYKFTATNSGHQIRVKGADFAQTWGKIQLFTGDCNNLVSVGCTDTYAGDSIVYNAIGLNPGETYLFKVYSINNIYGAPFEVCVLSNNDDCENADPIAVNTDYRCLSVTTGSTNNATASAQPVCTGNADDDKWYKFTATGTTLNIKLTPAAVNGIDNAVMEIFSGDCTALNSIYCVNNTTGADAEEQLATGLTIGDTYFIRVYSFDDITGKGDFELCISSPIPANDECNSAINLVPAEIGCTNPAFGTTIGATASGQPACDGIADDDVWYKFTAVASRQLITLTPTAVNGIIGGVVELFSGDCSSLNNEGCVRDYGSGIAEFPANALTVGVTYYLRIHSYDDNYGNGDFTLCVSTYNEICEGAQTLIVNLDNNCTNTTSGYSYNAGNSTQIGGCAGSPDDNVWYKFVATATSHRIKVTPSATNGIRYPVLETFEGTCGNLSSTSCTYNNNPPDALVEKSLTNLIIGNTYYVRVYSYSDGFNNGYFDICVTTPTLANDECTGAVNLTVIASTTCNSPVNGTTIGASQSMPACNQTTITYADDDVWYKFTAIGTTTHFDITPFGPNALFDPVMQLFQANNCGEIGNYGSSCYDNLPGTGAFDFRTYTIPGAVYYFRIYSAANGTGQGDFTICTYFDGPANDDCGSAIDVPVNNDNSCTLTTAGTTLYATSSNMPGGCTSSPYSSPDDDVWYKFTATAASHVITVTPTAVGGIDDVVLRMYDGNCGNFTYFTCINNTTGANAETYTAGNLTIGNTYYFSVHSYLWSYGIAGEGAFTVCIKKTVANDECTGAITIPVNDDATCTNIYQGTTVGSSNSPLPLGCGSNDVWYKFIANSTAYNITVTPAATGGIANPAWELISGTCSNLTSLGCRNNSSTYENLTVGNTYYLKVGSNGAQGAFTICAKSISLANDICSGAINVPISNADTCVTSVTGTNVGSTSSQVNGYKDVWYKFTATSIAHKINITPTADSISYPAFEIYTGNCGNLTSLEYINSNSQYAALKYSIENLTVGNTYYIRVFSNSNITGSFNICVSQANNDVCTLAKTLTVNTGLACTIVTTDSTDYATFGSGYANCDYNINDVWFKFISLATSQKISVTGNGKLEVFSGTCGALNSLGCFTGSVLLGGLSSDSIYFVRVYGVHKFDICVSATASNDDCAGAIALTVNSASTCLITTAGTSANASQSITGCVGTADDDVWYKFTATATAHKITVTPGTISNAVVEIFSGACGNLTVLQNGCFYNAGSSVQSAGVQNLTVGETYYIRVYSFGNNTGQGTFTICVGDLSLANDICSQAVPITVNSGTLCNNILTGTTVDATQSMTGCAGTADDDVWYKFIATSTSHNIIINATVVAGIQYPAAELFSGTCGSLVSLQCSGSTTISSNSFGQGNLIIGNTYYVRVYSTGSSLSTEGAFTICVSTPNIANDDCSNAVSLTVNANNQCTITTIGNTTEATQSFAGCTGTADDDVWYSFVATATSHKIVVNSSIGGGIQFPVIELFSGSCAGLTSLQCYATTTSSGNTLIKNGLVIGNTYYVRVYSYGSLVINRGSFTICIGVPVIPANDNCSGAVVLTVNPDNSCAATVTGTTIDASQSQVGCVGAADDDVWYKFTATQSDHQITVTPTASNGINDIVFEVFSGTCGALTSLKCVNNTTANAAETKTFFATVGTTYYVRVYSSSASPSAQGSFEICIKKAMASLYGGVLVSDLGTGNNIGNANTSRNIAIDTTGVIFAAFTGSQGIRVAKSTNRGQSFTASVQVSSTNAEPEIAVGNNGYVYVCWDNGDSIYLSVSTNGAELFSTPVVVGVGGFEAVHMALYGSNVYLINRLGSMIFNNHNYGIGVFTSVNLPSSYVYSDIRVSSNGDVYAPTDDPFLRLFKSVDSANTFNQITLNPGGDIYYSSYSLSEGQLGSYIFAGGFDLAGYKFDLTNGNTTTLNLGNNITDQGRTLFADNYGDLVDGYRDADGDLLINVSYDQGQIFSSSIYVASGGSHNIDVNQVFGDIDVVYESGGQVYLKVYPDLLTRIRVGQIPLHICAGRTFGVPYSIFGKFNAGNIFTAQLSDASGSFSSPVNIGSLTSIVSDTIPVVIPANTLNGANYRIRIVSSNIPYTGVKNNSGIIINTGTVLASSADRNTIPITTTNIPVTVSDSLNTCELICTITSTGTTNQLFGNTTARVTIDPSVQAYLNVKYVQRHYDIEPSVNPATSTASIILYYTNEEFQAYNLAVGNGLQLPDATLSTTINANNLRIIQYHGIGTTPGNYNPGTMETITPTSVVWNSTTVRWEVSFDVNGFSGFFVQTTDGALPLTLLNFSGHKQNTHMLLNWKTTNEINTSHFIVQRSANGTFFNNIGRVEARNTSGNNDYSFTDVSPINGINFYRLQMLDIDGKMTYSAIIKIVFTGKNELQVFPNPANNIITLSGLQSKGVIKIMSADGKLVMQMAVTNNSLLVDISKWAKGMYILQYNDGEKVQQIKIIKE